MIAVQRPWREFHDKAAVLTKDTLSDSGKQRHPARVGFLSPLISRLMPVFGDGGHPWQARRWWIRCPPRFSQQTRPGQSRLITTAPDPSSRRCSSITCLSLPAAYNTPSSSLPNSTFIRSFLFYLLRPTFLPPSPLGSLPSSFFPGRTARGSSVADSSSDTKAQRSLAVLPLPRRDGSPQSLLVSPQPPPPTRPVSRPTRSLPTHLGCLTYLLYLAARALPVGHNHVS